MTVLTLGIKPQYYCKAASAWSKQAPSWDKNSGTVSMESICLWCSQRLLLPYSWSLPTIESWQQEITTKCQFKAFQEKLLPPLHACEAEKEEFQTSQSSAVSQRVTRAKACQLSARPSPSARTQAPHVLYSSPRRTNTGACLFSHPDLYFFTESLGLHTFALLKYPPCPTEQISEAQRQLHPPCLLWGAAASVSVCLIAWGWAPPPKACDPLDSQPGQKEERWD